MVTQYDEKGKIFTQVVSKEPILVVIQTGQVIVRGLIHVRPDTRLKDELNNLRERFVAVTDASVTNLHGEELYRSNFLVLNIDQIIWITPQDQLLK